MYTFDINFRFFHTLMTDGAAYEGGVAVSHSLMKRPTLEPFSFDGYVSLVLERGWIEGRINGIEYHVDSPSIIFVPRHQILEETRSSTDMQMTQLFLSNEYVEQLFIPDLNLHDKVILQMSSYPLSQEQLASAQRLISAIEGSIKNDMMYKDRYIRALVELWVFDDDLQKFHSGLKEHQLNETVQKFLDAVKTCAVQQTRVEYYADLVCKSPSQLERVIRQHTEKTVMQWINYYRIEHCKAALISGYSSISQIAQELNFSSPEYLCRFFRQQTGMSPSEYRRQTKK